MTFAEALIEGFSKFADNPNECRTTKFVNFESEDGKLKIAAIEIEFGPAEPEPVKKSKPKKQAKK